ncbi:aminotransferase class V-fold PLP-dependent enzyme [Spirosoma sp. HMF4905]|uniref:Aminotransferase class V-fold PLP-dependent enzyme n=1 Tax=Spirosoma arboris TaxID=2682092 RepID=A0A7K1SIQ2_9BACT|nr:aminotransferase class V-fold PLP-dependent enzyme [Spirosoma arboris]MVM33446.1 aminotransferase class V-fold PLP-dependent enzyme [Spirosoma arboris]
MNLSSKRRGFLKRLMAGSVAALTQPLLVESAEAATHPGFLSDSPQVVDEAYWQTIKEQFAVPANLMMVNAANLCPRPQFITDLIRVTATSLEKDVSFQNRSQFEARRQLALEKLAQFIGVSSAEVGITRNTTESNNMLVNGLDFKAGDEIIIWDQNHPTNGLAWEQKAKRQGFTVKKVSIPAGFTTTQDLIAPFQQAITPKTRLITFSHISNSTGLMLPAKELCQLASSRGILTLVDGAQSFGFMELDLKTMGCDFYTASTHKWLMGPLENGILFSKKEHLAKLWPSVIGVGWHDDTQTVDKKICLLGQRNDPTTSALPAILDFHEKIGRKTIEDRVRHLTLYLKESIQKQIPQASFITPLSAQMSGGIVTVSIPGKPSADLFQKLYSDYGIACASVGNLRISPHIYNTHSDLDKLVKALVTLSS